MKLNKSKTTFLGIPILLGIFLLGGFMFFVFGHNDWEDYYEKQLKNDIRTINFPGGYYHLYQERNCPDDPWTTYLDMYTNFQTKNDVFSYIEYQMEELNKSFSDPEFEDNFLENFQYNFLN